MKRAVWIERGINLRALAKVWREAGGRVLIVRRTGEARLLAPNGEKSTVFNRRRKDAPRAVVGFARRFV